MKLYLVQHGDAVPEKADPARPLSKQGRRDVRALAKFLDRGDVAVARIVHSGKLRAEETAAIIAARVARGRRVEAAKGLNPDDPPRAAAQKLARSAADVLVVSHMPLLGKLAAVLLTGKKEPAIVAFRPGAALCLERGARGAWTIAWFMPPGLPR